MSSKSNPWHIFYVFEATPSEAGFSNRTVIRADLLDNLYLTMRWFGDFSGLGRYQIFDTNPNSPTAGQHLFQRGSVKLSTVPVKENNDF